MFDDLPYVVYKTSQHRKIFFTMAMIIPFWTFQSLLQAQPQAQVEPSAQASLPPAQPKAAALPDRPAAPAAPAAAAAEPAPAEPAAEAAAEAPSKTVSEAGEAAGEATATPVEGKETWCWNDWLNGPFRGRFDGFL